MNSLLLVFLSLSFSGSLLGLLLFALRPLLRSLVSRKWQYYIWLVVVLRLLIPFGPEASLTARFIQGVQGIFSRASPAEPEFTISPEEAFLQEEDLIIESAVGTDLTEDMQADSPSLRQELTGSLWLLWLAGACTLLVRKCSGYHAFLGYIKAGRRPVKDGPVWEAYQRICGELGIRRPPALYCNPIAAAPMLAGVLRPFIVLPALEEEMAEYILRHELTHYQRGDIFYKWLAQLAACLHWFNPLVYPLLRAVNRDCELSCDEAVIRSMNEEQKFCYGETLLAAIKPDPGYSNAIVSITLNEDVQRLKERLDAIMTFQIKSRLASGASALLAALLASLALWTGVYAAPQSKTSGETLAADQFAQSAAWQEFLGQDKSMVNNWPRYIGVRYNGLDASPVSCSFYVREDTEVLLTAMRNSGKLGVTVRTDSGHAAFHYNTLESGRYYFTIPASEERYWFDIYGGKFSGDLLLEVLGPAPKNGTAEASPNDKALPSGGTASQDIPAYLEAFEWEGYGITGRWPDYYGVRGEMSSSGSSTWTDFTVDTPTTAVITAHTTGGRFGLRVVDPNGSVIFHQPNIITARYRVKLSAVGDYRIYYDYDKYYGKMLFENEAHNTSFRGMDLGEVHGNDAEYDPAKAGSQKGKSTAVDEAARHVMTYSHSWEMVETMLPYMTKEGIDKVVALNNQYSSQYNTGALRSASDYYNLATPGRDASDQASYGLMQNSGNWRYSSPLFPYMSNGGIDKVVALYNQKTGSSENPADYYN